MRPLTSALLALTLSASFLTSAQAQDSRPAAAKAPVEPTARLKVEGWPASLSPSGKHVLLVKPSEGEAGGYQYHLANLEGDKLTSQELFDVPLRNDDQIAYLSNGGSHQWSASGDRFAYLTSEGKGAPIRCGVSTLDGAKHTFEAEGSKDTYALCFSPIGKRGYYVEGSHKFGRGGGARIRAFTTSDKGVTVDKAPLWSSDEINVYFMSPSPQGTHLGMLVVAGRAVKVGFLELKTGKLTTSEAVRVDDHFFKPRVDWTRAGDALVLTTRGESGKWPANVVRCEAATGALKVLVKEGSWALISVLREGPVVLYDRGKKLVALMDPTTGAVTQTDWKTVVFQQAKGRSLFLSPETDWVYVD